MESARWRASWTLVVIDGFIIMLGASERHIGTDRSSFDSFSNTKTSWVCFPSWTNSKQVGISNSRGLSGSHNGWAILEMRLWTDAGARAGSISIRSR